MKVASNLPVFSWFDKNTVKHLRMPFSFFLMPVFLFAVSQASQVNWDHLILAFLILHILIFPSSNGYNSYQDRDETSIGGLKYPPKITYKLFYATLLMDVVAIVAGLFISVYFSMLLLVFILMSRAYSFRNIRLKKYPIAGFLTVFIFQGAFVYFISMAAITDFYGPDLFSLNALICMSISSLFIGSIYPLTQIYQHQADKMDGVISLSYKLGYSGTFIFSAILYSVATVLLYWYFSMKGQSNSFMLFSLLMLPVIYKLITWFVKVRKDTLNANFENTMAMNLLTSVIMNLYFLLLILNRYENWF